MTAAEASMTCPGPEELEAFASDQADAAVSAHVRQCAACRDAVADIRANNALLVKIYESGVGSALDRRLPVAHMRAGAAPHPDIEDYDILEEIHRGAQGVVFRAVQKRARRAVALKLLLAGSLATTPQRRRFEREIEAVAALVHPNIVTIYDSGVTDSGQLFFAMQFIDGMPLNEWMRRLDEAPASRRDVLAMFIVICEAVHHAHRHGVIHRDLKPANILVDREGRPHVVDFGLARVAKAEPEPHLTATGQFMGTLAYTSPEQAAGAVHRVDVRSDVYALGVILYELLTAELPFELTEDLKGALHALTEADPHPPSACRNSRFSIDRDLETIVLKAMAREPGRRYQSASALARDLTHYLTGQAIDARRDSTWYVMRKTVRRHRGPFAVAATLVLLLAGFGASMAVLYQRAATEAAKVRQTNIFLEDTLGSVQPAAEGRDVTVRELLDEAVEWIDIALGDQPEIAASIRTTVGGSYRSLGLYDQAETQLVAALQTRQRLFGRDHLDVAHSLNALGLLRWNQGDFEAAEDLMRRALVIRERRLGTKSHEVSLTLSNLARLRRDRGELDDAQRLLDRSLAIRRALFGETHADIAMCLFDLAGIAMLRGDPESAIALHEQALAIRRSVLHRSHPDLSRSLYALGAIHLQGGDTQAAEPPLRTCYQLRLESWSGKHRQTAEAGAALGRCLLDLHRFEEAETILSECVDTLAALASPEDEQLQAGAHALVAFYESNDRPALADRYRHLLEGAAPEDANWRAAPSQRISSPPAE